MNSIQLSIVVIGRNEASRIGDCLRVAQNEIESIPQSELIFIDVGSTDDSVGIAKSCGVNAIEIGPSNAARARNEGWRCSRGEFVHFLDGDMILIPGWIRSAMERIDILDCQAIAGRVVEDMAGASIYSRVFGGDWSQTDGEVETLGGAALWRSSVLRELGGFDTSLDVGEDPDLSIRARSLGHKLVQLDSPMVSHALELRSLADWIRRGQSVGKSTALMFKKHRHCLGAQKRLTRAVRDIVAAILLIGILLIWPIVGLVMILSIFPALIVRKIFRSGTQFAAVDAIAHLIHVHLIKIPFMIGALPVLLSNKKETIQ